MGSPHRIVVGINKNIADHKTDTVASVKEPESDESSIAHLEHSRACLILLDDPVIRLVVVKRITNDHAEPLAEDDEDGSQKGERPRDKGKDGRPLLQKSLEASLVILVKFVVGEVLGIIPKGLSKPEHVGGD